MSGAVILALRILLAASLYVFLGWGLYLLWQDLRRTSRSLIPHAPTLTLVINGADQKVEFKKPEVNIGRDPACDFTLDDKTVSTQHARLSYHHKQWWIEDLGSTNGTFLNQDPVSAPLVVANGDLLRCGGVVLSVQIESDGEQFF